MGGSLCCLRCIPPHLFSPRLFTSGRPWGSQPQTLGLSEGRPWEPVRHGDRSMCCYGCRHAHHCTPARAIPSTLLSPHHLVFLFIFVATSRCSLARGLCPSCCPSTARRVAARPGPMGRHRYHAHDTAGGRRCGRNIAGVASSIDDVATTPSVP